MYCFDEYKHSTGEHGIGLHKIGYLVDEAGAEVARFDLSLEGGNYTGLIMSKLYRHNSEWKMQALGEHAEGRTFHDLLPAIKPYL